MGSLPRRDRVGDRHTGRGMWTLVAAASAMALAACGGGSTQTSGANSSPGGTCQGSSGNASATTASYVVVLDVGPAEQMYSQQEADSTHPSSGEVMLGGSMTDVSGPSVRHVEAHICSRSGGSVVTGAQPAITITDTTAGTGAHDLPVAEMQGVGQGPSDYHYGNNAVLQAGHSYTIAVRINGESAALTYKAS